MEEHSSCNDFEQLFPIGTICGCLTVIDNGSEYIQLAASEEYGSGKRIKYKCKCRKCGKIRYYSRETLQKKPQYCRRPIYCSSRFTYSIRAQNSRFRKWEKYENDESVRLVENKDDVAPAEDYCEKWNAKRAREMEKQAENEAAIIAALPRKTAKNYDMDFVGMNYESLEILECVNEAFERIPQPRLNSRHQKCYGTVTVYKQYRCRCYLCGEEKVVNCDQFGIYPPTEYGVRAYDGYWSNLYCDCHPISSFQWKVNKLLFDNQVPYQVEYSFPDLFGSYGNNNLRFDFAIIDDDGSVKCLIECQGEQHYKPVKEFGGKTQFAIQQENDRLKREYAQTHGLVLLEISYKEKKYEKIEAVLKKHNII